MFRAVFIKGTGKRPATLLPGNDLVWFRTQFGPSHYSYKKQLIRRQMRPTPTAATGLV